MENHGTTPFYEQCGVVREEGPSPNYHVWKLECWMALLYSTHIHTPRLVPLYVLCQNNERKTSFEYEKSLISRRFSNDLNSFDLW